MKKKAVLLSVLAVICGGAAEVDVDGSFQDFRRNWSVSATRNGTAEMIPVNGVNIVQIAADDDNRGSIGIYTARGFAGVRGDVITVSVNAKGGDFEVALNEYGNNKVTGKQRQMIKKSSGYKICKVSFSVREAATDLVRIAFNVKKGAVVTISGVNVEKNNHITAAE